ncbi:hypothetical protein HG535_0B05810 [Zygotorulaspora mrakii]|uniref:Uncharacterized protein n=1 Tax=Zygotorulaspora mrakii TaxID=42260 RepID=A0A7H9AZD3_ZYGMR|nr:uncharacterized protein HG535_0B05810 [Zygotorulaspora mrakii]QLG71537.1 hypothetical protein HG535_0B05810 [Zygotorulaspora mrakii]
MSFNNGFTRRSGSRSAIQATIASANVQSEHGYGYDVDSIEAFDDVRVLNNPDTESYGISTSEESRNGAVVYELRSEEFAILSTESSSSSEINQPTTENLLVCSVPSSNSQRIDEWCMNNELDDFGEHQKHALTSLRVQDVIQSWGVDQAPNKSFGRDLQAEYQLKGDPYENYASKMLQELNGDQLFKVKQLTKELLPLLRNSRRSHSVFTHRFRNIPSVFSQRDLILTFSLQYNESESSSTTFLDKFSSVSLDDGISISSQGNSSWLGWTLVPRFTDNELS